MARDKEVNWRDSEKIDPAFDELVKGYIEILEFCEQLPNDGHLSLNDEFAKIVNDDSGWQDNYFTQNNGEDVLHFVEETALKNDVVFQLLNYPFDDKEGYIEICKKVTEGLPEKSKKFYLKNIELFQKDSNIKPPFNLSEVDINHKNIDFYSTISSLIMINIFSLIDYEEATKEEVEAFKNPEVMNHFIGAINNLTSELAFKSTIKRLLEIFVNEKKDRALCDALKIDKTVLYFDEVEERIREAQLTGDRTFLRSIGKAIAENPFEKSSGSGYLVPVFIFFWVFGLYKLSRPEQYKFAISCDLISRQYSYGAFEKEIQRYVLPYFK